MDRERSIDIYPPQLKTLVDYKVIGRRGIYCAMCISWRSNESKVHVLK